MKLYIIGNGFDIGHGIPCKYSDFYIYLERNREDVLEEMEQYYYVDSDSELWSDFERGLEEGICYDSLADIIYENTPNFASDEFRDADWYDAQIYIEEECNKLLNYIRSGFEEWINSLELDTITKKYEIDKTARFFTFNYTEVLEKIYEIPAENIFHIHKKVGEELIFGHGKDVEKFNVKKALYGDENAHLIINEEMGDVVTTEDGHEQFAESAVCAFYDKMRKHTNEIIKEYSNQFHNLSDIDEVIVIGHSYNEIDFPYFKKISESINNRATWTLYYYSESDRVSAEKLMAEIHIGSNLLRYNSCLGNTVINLIQ